MAANKTSFKKGHKPTKPKGAVSAKTKAWDELGDFLTKDGAERAKEIMMSSNPDKFMNYYGMFLEYFKPKHSRSDVNQNNTGKTEIIIKRESTDSYPPVISSSSGTDADTTKP